MIDFTDDDITVLNDVVNRFIIHKRLSNRNDKFSCMGRPNKFQELERKGIILTSHKGDRIKQKYYWWYLTDAGLDIVQEMVVMREL